MRITRAFSVMFGRAVRCTELQLLGKTDHHFMREGCPTHSAAAIFT